MTEGKTTSAIVLTKGEACALLHRLEMTAEIVEVLTADLLDTDPVTVICAEYEDAAQRLLRHVLAERKVPTTSTKYEREVLIEAIEGSTYLASLDDEPQKRAALYRVMSGLADKMVAAGVAPGINVPTN
jgi:hypothetical protein